MSSPSVRGALIFILADILSFLLYLLLLVYSLASRLLRRRRAGGGHPANGPA